MQFDSDIGDKLAALGIIDPAQVEVLHDHVRDSSSIKVLRCGRSGVIFLSGRASRGGEYYGSHPGFSYWSASTRAEALQSTREDDERRARQCGSLIEGRKWLDIGTGIGGVLDLLGGKAAEVFAVEPQPAVREELRKLGYSVVDAVADLPPAGFDVVTMFHVLEHLPDPVAALAEIRDHMTPGGTLVVEVPHARDALLTLFESEAFKDFTFWSEHLVLHTRDSLRVMLEAAGYRGVGIKGYQRYPLPNHLHWLAKGAPGGQKTWSMLKAPELDDAYAALLNRLDMTDTLIAIAESP